jgi:hypothetical protein
MSILSSSLRSFRPPGLNAVTGNVQKGVANWLLDEEFQFPASATASRFVIHISDPNPFLAALAADVINALLVP